MNVSLSSLCTLFCVPSMLVLLLVSVSDAQAEEFKYPEIKQGRHGGVTLTPMVGSYLFDDDRALDDDTVTGLAIGYRFSHPLAIELLYLNGDATTTAGTASGDLKQYRLEGLYDVAEYGAWTPYIAVGAANTEFGSTLADDEGAMTLGVGTHYSLSDRVALRLDSRYIKAVGDTKGADVALALGLNVFLGQTAAAVTPPTEIIVEQPSAPPSPAGPTLAELCAQAGGQLTVDDSCVRITIATERVTLNVQFEYNSDKVQSPHFDEVEKLADFMKTYPTASVVIEGHTDSTGSDVYNQNLSQRRVNEVMRILAVDYGIETSRMSAVGFGESQPAVPNDTEINRAKNRRVVASISVELEETLQLDVK